MIKFRIKMSTEDVYISMINSDEKAISNLKSRNLSSFQDDGYVNYMNLTKNLKNDDFEKVVKKDDLNYFNKSGILHKDFNHNLKDSQSLSFNVEGKSFFSENFTRKFDERNILEFGLVLLANRSDNFRDLMIYPKVFLINNMELSLKNIKNLKDDQKNHIKDIDRIIIIEKFHSTDTEQKFDFRKGLLICIHMIDLIKHDNVVNDGKIKLKAFKNTFKLYSSKTVNYLFKIYDTFENNFKNEINTSDILQFFTKESSQNYDIDIDETSKKIFVVDEILIKNHSSLIGITGSANFTNPTENMDYWTLFLIEYYMRNLENPSYRGNDVLEYLKKNQENIKKIFKTAISTKNFVINVPRVSRQVYSSITYGHLDEYKLNSVLDYIEKQFTQKQKKNISHSLASSINSDNSTPIDFLDNLSETNSDISEESF